MAVPQNEQEVQIAIVQLRARCETLEGMISKLQNQPKNAGDLVDRKGFMKVGNWNGTEGDFFDFEFKLQSFLRKSTTGGWRSSWNGARILMPSQPVVIA